jgi:hypothetical protein
MDEARIDLLQQICAAFNRNGVKYVICGAFASKLHRIENESGQMRLTKDYDFMVDASPGNVRRIKKALQNITPEIAELREDDFREHATIQVVDEEKSTVIDLISRMWGIDYDKAREDCVTKELDTEEVPVMSIRNLLVMKKDSHRSQDKFDCYWLRKIKDNGTKSASKGK